MESWESDEVDNFVRLNFFVYLMNQNNFINDSRLFSVIERKKLEYNDNKNQEGNQIWTIYVRFKNLQKEMDNQHFDCGGFDLHDLEST